MTETQRRIRAYKKALPELRERVIAVALLLAMSASMLASASFAWITLSTAPEVSGMATTVAANGNLEIALAQGESMKNGVPVAAKEPNETAIGDSSVAQGIVNSNVTWGNLVNLSDPEYGVNKIALRPALLNNTNRNKYPLYGAKYGSDGRVENTTQRYEFTSYQIIDEGLGVRNFAAGDKAKYGVRAISSVGYDSSVGDAILDEYNVLATQAYGNVVTEYQKIIDPDSNGHLVLTSGRDCIEALEGLVGVFAQDKINTMTVPVIGDLAPTVNGENWKNKKMNCSMYIYDVYEMLLQMKTVLEWEGEGLRQLANSQGYSKTGSRATFETVEQLLQSSETALKNMDINLVSFKEFQSNYNTILGSINTLVTNPLIASVEIGELKGIEAFSLSNHTGLPEVHYEDIDDSVNKLFDMSNTTIGGTKINSLSGSTALDILNKDNNPVVIKGGVLAAFEKRALADSTQRLNQTARVAIKARILGDKTVKGVVTTENYQYSHVEGDKTYLTDLKNTDAGGVTGAGEAVAKDTYGMAIDLWVRTNYPDAVLTLEGNVLTQQIHAQDAEGKYLYTLTVEEIVHSLYSENQNSGPYFYAADDTEVPQAVLDSGTLSIVYTDQVIGYEGENRIWSDEALATMGQYAYLADDSTSQGSGSCFVFYAESKPEEQKLLEMMESFTIAFLDGNGGRLGTAKLNTANKHENQGKITVPLEIVSGVQYEEALESGETLERTGIMTLEQNLATRITAIVYLDGTNMQNQNVLAAGELMGQLNIQFGTNTTLLPPPDENLQQEYRTITVSAQSEDGQKWPEAAQISYENYEHDPDGRNITVNLNVDGVQPDKIEGFFVRVISATQGSRMETVEFTPVAAAADEGNGKWTANFNLVDPGVYVLSDLLVDGMQYQLAKDAQTKNHLTVMIPGLSLGTVTANPSGTIRTAESSYSIQVSAQILADVRTPQRVTAHFYEKGNEYNQVTARLTNIGNTSWQGNAVFSSSGTYVLDSITVDGTSLDITNKTEITFFLGMRCEVYNDHEDLIDSFEYEGVPVQVPVTVKIWDDGNNEITNLSGVTLRYKMGNSYTRGTQTDMTWNSGGYYTGTLNLTSPETYTFEYLEMNLGTSMGKISSTNVSPTFRLKPKDPPAYVEGSAKAFGTQLAIDANVPATLSVDVLNTVADNVIWAEMTKGSEKVYVSAMPTTGDDTVTFTLNGLSDGTWTLTNLYAQGFTHSDGTVYDVNDPNNLQEGESLGFRLTGVNEIQTRIVKNIKVTTVLNDNDYIYEGSFMQEHYPALTVKVTDQAGNVIDGVSIAGGTWNVTHAGKQFENGGYTGNYGDGKYAVPISTAGVAQFADGSQGADELRTAGIYTSTMTLQLEADNGKANYSANISDFTVKSTKPTVSITARSNYGSSSNTPTSATVYFNTTQNTTCGITTTNYSQPHVTITIGNMGDATEARLFFKESNGGTVHLYTSNGGKTATDYYSWTANGGCQRWVGYFESVSAGNDKKTDAGTLTATELIMIYNESTLTFKLAEVTEDKVNSITISNPG